MNPQGWKPPSGFTPITRGLNIYKIQEPAQAARKMDKLGQGTELSQHKPITSGNRGMTEN